jgi:hypothetical protein
MRINVTSLRFHPKPELRPELEWHGKRERDETPGT